MTASSIGRRTRWLENVGNPSNPRLAPNGGTQATTQPA
jgi:hypothetical protein